MASADVDMRTHAEKERAEANIESAPREVKARVQPTLPVKVDATATAAFEAIAKKTTSIALFRLERETETLFGETHAGSTPAELAALMHEAEPRYALMHFRHTQPKEAGGAAGLEVPVFVYFCPDSSPPFLRMLYSTVKLNMSIYAEQFEIPVAKSLEISEKSDLSVEWFVHELYPQQVEKKVFKKPARPGGRRPGAARKFQAPQ